MTNDEIIEVVTAHKNGAIIEFLLTEYPSLGWSNCFNNCPIWDFSSAVYRVKLKTND